MRKSSISMAMFNSYVKLPEGKLSTNQWLSGSWFRSDHLWGLGVPPDSLDHRWVFVGENAEHHPGEVIIISKLDVGHFLGWYYIYIYM